MVQFMSGKKYALLMGSSFAFVFIFIFIILLTPAHERSLVNLAILPLVLTAIATAAVYFPMNKTLKDKQKVVKYTAIVFLFALILFESVMALITIHSIISIALLIPIDLVLLSLPLYVTFRGTRGIREGDEYSSELSERLATLTGNASHKVYIRTGTAPSMAGTTDGSDWSMIIYNSTLERLNDEELEMLMLEKYYSKEVGHAKSIIYFAFGTFVFLADLILATYIIGMNLPPAYEEYILPTQAVILVMIFALPFLIKRKSVSHYREIDKKILSVNGNRMALISLIEKENDFDPPATMTQYQYYRYKDRQKKNAESRIKNIE